MNQPDKSVTLETLEAKQLMMAYRAMSDDVQCLAYLCGAALEIAEAKPAKLAELKERCKGLEKRIKSRLDEFARRLERDLHLSAEPSAAPNDGPAAHSADPGASEWPSSVS